MTSYAVYLVIFGMYLVLFAIAKGLFAASADVLIKRFPHLKGWCSSTALREALMIFFIMNLLGMLVTWNSLREDTVAKGYLLRNEYGGAERSEQLEAEVSDQSGETSKEKVDITLDSRHLTGEEKEAALDNALRELPDLVLGEQSADHVTEALHLPSTLEDDLIEVSWIIDNTDLIDTDGTLGENLPKNGAEALLHASLTVMDDEEMARDFDLNVTVFPKKLSASEQLRQDLRERIDKDNRATEEKVTLPQEVDGKSIVWSKNVKGDGIRMLFLGALLAFGMIYRQTDAKRRTGEARKNSLLMDYPGIVSKLVLYLSAGMSSRNALARMAGEYQKRRSKTHAGEAEIIAMVREMSNGVTEREAYEHLGRRCEVAEYKALSNILLQNSMKGGRELLTMLEREAAEAEELRRKHARRLGEEAGTKLLFPMLVMLMIVMAILMVPAIVNFQF